MELCRPLRLAMLRRLAAPWSNDWTGVCGVTGRCPAFDWLHRSRGTWLLAHRLHGFEAWNNEPAAWFWGFRVHESVFCSSWVFRSRRGMHQT